MARIITRVVLILSFVSFFADISSEMLYPILPLFLDQIGAGALAIGLLEGMAALVAGFGKAWFGSLSDLLDRRNIFIRSGYFLSAVAKPLIGLVPKVGMVFGARALDRVGKGMRSAARDAVLVAESSPENRGKVFGFHRGMDTFGAVIGPGVALLWLYFHPGDYVSLFLIAFVPGILGVLLTFFLQREPKVSGKIPGISAPFTGIFDFWKIASPSYKRLLLCFLLFSLVNSSDLFLMLKASESGMGPAEVIGAYILYNLVYALASYPLGALGDRIGFKPVFLAAVLVFGLTYIGFGLGRGAGLLWALFGLYGIFTAGHEGIAKSWLSLHIPKEHKATGLGLFLFLNTLAVLLASPLAGLLWQLSSGRILFVVTGLAALGLFFLLLFLLPAQAVNVDEKQN